MRQKETAAPGKGGGIAKASGGACLISNIPADDATGKGNLSEWLDRVELLATGGRNANRVRAVAQVLADMNKGSAAVMIPAPCLAARAGVGLRSLRGAVATLVGAGLLRHEAGNGRGLVSVYELRQEGRKDGR